MSATMGARPFWSVLLALLAVTLFTSPASCDALIGDTECIDIPNGSPARARWGHIEWKDSTDPNCPSRFPLDSNGECFHYLSLSNGCNTFCKVATTWFFGEPIDMQNGQVCDRTESCAYSFSYSESLSKALSVGSTASISENTSNTTTYSKVVSMGHTFEWNAKMNVGVHLHPFSGGGGGDGKDEKDKKAEKPSTAAQVAKAAAPVAEAIAKAAGKGASDQDIVIGAQAAADLAVEFGDGPTKAKFEGSVGITAEDGDTKAALGPKVELEHEQGKKTTGKVSIGGSVSTNANQKTPNTGTEDEDSGSKPGTPGNENRVYGSIDDTSSSSGSSEDSFRTALTHQSDHEEGTALGTLGNGNRGHGSIDDTSSEDSFHTAHTHQSDPQEATFEHIEYANPPPPDPVVGAQYPTEQEIYAPQPQQLAPDNVQGMLDSWGFGNSATGDAEDSAHISPYTKPKSSERQGSSNLAEPPSRPGSGSGQPGAFTPLNIENQDNSNFARPPSRPGSGSGQPGTFTPLNIGGQDNSNPARPPSRPGSGSGHQGTFTPPKTGGQDNSNFAESSSSGRQRNSNFARPSSRDRESSYPDTLPPTANPWENESSNNQGSSSSHTLTQGEGGHRPKNRPVTHPEADRKWKGKEKAPGEYPDGKNYPHGKVDKKSKAPSEYRNGERIGGPSGTGSKPGRRHNWRPATPYPGSPKYAKDAGDNVTPSVPSSSALVHRGASKAGDMLGGLMHSIGRRPSTPGSTYSMDTLEPKPEEYPRVWRRQAGAIPVDLDFEFGMRSKAKYDIDETVRQDWVKSVSESRSFSVSNTTTFTVTVGKSQAWTKPDYAKDYCGSWFVVPYVAIDCGRGARGELTRDGKCALEPRTASFGHCFDYTFKDSRYVDESKHQKVFVLRDCSEGYVLPGEWQHPFFRSSFSLDAMVNYHIRRFGFATLPNTLNREPAPSWYLADRGPGDGQRFTKLLGPEDHTIKLCGRGNYCARYKLADKTCLTLPRGYLGTKMAHIVSATTTSGNCCVLFSRPECHGLPQLITGEITDLNAVGYNGQTHSVLCNAPEYCDQNRIDQALVQQGE